MNEIQLGLVPPIFCMFNFLNVLPRRVAERALVQGRIFTTEQALQIGLVDAVASSKEKALEKCSQFIATFGQTNPLARSLTKLKFRGADLQRFESERTKELESFLEFIDHPQMQEDLGIYLEGLKKKNRN